MTSGDLHIEFGLYVDRLDGRDADARHDRQLVRAYLYDRLYARRQGVCPLLCLHCASLHFRCSCLSWQTTFLQLFVFWEAVGLCSYLLIGYWYERDAARAAGTKAFFVNRIGDFGFLLGLLLVLLTFGTLEYRHVFAQAADFAGATTNLFAPIGGTWQISTLTLICVLLFIGAIGKSAQFPLHVWLPDAMEGPTPISALIHAATMVTAGVFMVARLAPLYNLSPVAMDIVAATGALTMLLGASIALSQNDIKRIVAYSTVSQLGYMVMACGLGAYTAGMYHLLTHGAFKALLFLASGSVIIALHHEQDIRRMGGLKDKLPITYWTMVIGSLALAGFPFTSGFFSKDEILVGAWSSGSFGKVLAILGLLTAGLTAFYSFRLIFVAFWGRSKVDPHHAQHIREPSSTMTMPLIILAILSIAAGYVGIPQFLDPGLWGRRSPSWLRIASHHGAATVLGLVGIAVAYVFYVRSPGIADRLANQWRPLYDLSFNKWYVDEMYDRVIVRPTFRLADRMWAKIDVGIIDGAVNGVARAIAWWGWFMRLFQSGQTQHYALGMTLGAVLILTAYLLF